MAGAAVTDIFISYAHEDQPFVRRMVTSLEAEGFTVWWDHTIPPGKSWDSFIAKGISEARCCVVVWSSNSVDSDWVKEEATMAKDGHKFIPVQIDGSLPPVGFRRIQSANLQNWNGDPNNPQFQLLVREARALLSGSGPPRVSAPAPMSRAYTPPPEPPPKSPPWALIAAGAAAVGVAVIALVMLTRQPEASVEPPATEMAAVGEAVEGAVPPAETSPAATPPAGVDPAELERMRRERDQAVENARSQREENERLRREREAEEQRRQQQQTAANTQTAQAAPSGGAFNMSNSVCVGPRSWDGNSEGTYIFDAAGTITSAGWWRQNGDRVTGDTGSLVIDGRLVGSRLTGSATWSGSGGYAGTFDLNCRRR